MGEILGAILVNQVIQWLLGILVLFSDYMHIFKFSFNIPILPFQTNVSLLFSAKDMSRNVTLKIISE
jgi:hypothetical protein